MIEKMQMVYVVTSVSKKKEMLQGLRDLEIMHLMEKKGADKKTVDRFSTLSKTASTLKDYLPKKATPSDEILNDEDFDKMYADVLAAIDKKAELALLHSQANTELDRIRSWGDFDPSAVNELRTLGYDLHFYHFEKKQFEAAAASKDIKLIRLGIVDKQIAAAVLGTLPDDLSGTEFPLPERGISELSGIISDYETKNKQCDEILQKASCYEKSFMSQLLKVQNEEIFSSANATANSDESFVWLSGYIPEADIEAFKQKADACKWAYAIQDVDDDDEAVPTKLRFNKVSKLIKPVFDILGVLPGYREQDISLWFLLFFVLFFAMIIGDAGYGSLLLIVTIVLMVKSKKKEKKSDAVFLLLVLSIATICWGSITGTWFGMEGAMDIPFLKALVIPSFANYPEYFGVAAKAQQNTIIKFSFSIGAIQMALGSILSIKNKLPKKDLSWVADAGWAVSVVAMYLLSLYLVVGEQIDIKPVFVLVLAAFVLVLLFGGMSPDKSFAKGLLSGVGNGFTVFLDTISCFGNVMSYIRLFAVGMAGLAIAQSFNALAEGFSGPLIIMGIFVLVIGHLLNIIMAFLSVVVHGIRLNVLEFSGQVGLEWTGIAYEPFKKQDKLSK